MDINSFLATYEPDSYDEDIDFNEYEIEKLISHFNKIELNQYYLLIINKVIEKKSFSLDKNEIILNLLPIFTKIDLKTFPINTDKEIILFATIIGTFLFVIDIEEFGKTEF